MRKCEIWRNEDNEKKNESVKKKKMKEKMMNDSVIKIEK